MASPDLSRVQATELRAELRVVTDAGPAWSRQTYLRDGVWTVGDRALASDFRLRWLLQLASDLTRGRLRDLRVLDLGCEEGHFGLEFARHGAEVLAVDARNAHLQRARFMSEAIGLDNYRTELADVRELDPQTLGEFDLILCLGLHYHLDTPALFEFFDTLAQLCSWALFLHGQFSLHDVEARAWRGNAYHGRPVFEHPASSTPDQRLDLSLASVDNPESFWLTKPSLINLLTDSGFTSVCEQRAPRGATGHADRVDLLALKGAEPEVHAMPGTRGEPRPRWPERERLAHHPVHSPHGRLRDWIARAGIVSRLRGRAR